jgi:hypothetical protein
MSHKIVIIELDSNEAKSIVKAFRALKYERFFPDTFGEEVAHEAMEAMRLVLKETFDLLPPASIEIEPDFYSVSVELTSSQVVALSRFASKLLIEDVLSWGYSRNISKEVVNAMWCIQDGLIRAHRNIDQPLKW